MFTNDEKKDFLACNTSDKFKNFICQFDVNKFDEFGNTILHYYLKNIDSFKLDSKQVILEMIEQGININAQAEKGNFRHTPLSLSIDNNLKDIFLLILESGANVNQTVVNGNSVLSSTMMKIGIDHDYFIPILIKKGADVFLKNKYGVSPISLAHTINNYDFKKHFKHFNYSEE